MIKYFVSYAHVKGFGMTEIESDRNLCFDDIVSMREKISEMNLHIKPEEIIILNFIKLDN